MSQAIADSIQSAGDEERFESLTSAVTNNQADQRDLGTKFVPLVSATIVLTVGLADNIVTRGSSSTVQVVLLGTSWALLVGALSLIGLGLLYLHTASVLLRRSIALRSITDWWPPQRRAGVLYLIAGTAYVVAVALFSVAGLIDIMRS